jgi:hypothetical protein
MQILAATIMRSIHINKQLLIDYMFLSILIKIDNLKMLLVFVEPMGMNFYQ